MAKIQLKKGGKALRISEIFVLILHITAICIQAQTANFFTRLFTFYNMTFAVCNGSHSDAKIYMQLECETQRFCCCNCHVLTQVLSILMRNIPTF